MVRVGFGAFDGMNMMRNPEESHYDSFGPLP